MIEDMKKSNPLLPKQTLIIEAVVYNCFGRITSVEGIKEYKNEGKSKNSGGKFEKFRDEKQKAVSGKILLQEAILHL